MNPDRMYLYRLASVRECSCLWYWDVRKDSCDRRGPSIYDNTTIISLKFCTTIPHSLTKTLPCLEGSAVYLQQKIGLRQGRGPTPGPLKPALNVPS
jgi:hypothetical protein